MDSLTSWIAIGIIVCLNISALGISWGKLSTRLDTIDARLKLIENCFEIQLKPKKPIFNPKTERGANNGI